MTSFLKISAVLFGSLLMAGDAFAVGGEGADSESPVSTLDVAFELYVGGVPLGHVMMSARVQDGVYKAVSTLASDGVVNTFWQAKIETSASGSLAKGEIKPGVYDSFEQTRTDRRQVTLSFGPDGPDSIVSDPPYKDDDHPVSTDLKKHTFDPLSAGLYLITSLGQPARKPCELVIPIFDGRRRYDITFGFVKHLTVKMDNGLYAGPAEVCAAHYQQIAGYSQTVLEENKKFPTIYAWTVPLASKVDPSFRFVIPVRMWAETPYGIVAAVATQVKIDGVPLAKPN